MDKRLPRLAVVRDVYVANAQRSSPIFRKPHESDDPRLKEDNACVIAHQAIHYLIMNLVDIREESCSIDL